LKTGLATKATLHHINTKIVPLYLFNVEKLKKDTHRLIVLTKHSKLILLQDFILTTILIRIP
jgi:hypothetical protein